MWVLIVLAHYGVMMHGYVNGGGSGVQVIFQEFTSQEHCEAARAALKFPPAPENTSHNLVEDDASALKTMCILK